jgi:hypothetical protein
LEGELVDGHRWPVILGLGRVFEKVALVLELSLGVECRKRRTFGALMLPVRLLPARLLVQGWT